MTNSVKVEKFGDDKFAEMYELYRTSSLPDFKAWCVNAIDKNSVAVGLKKQEFTRSINQQASKDRIVQKMTDFFLAGQGMKTINLKKPA